MLPTTCAMHCTLHRYKYNAADYMHIIALHKYKYDAAKHKEQDNNAEDKQNAAADQNVIIVTTAMFRFETCNCIFLQRT